MDNNNTHEIPFLNNSCPNGMVEDKKRKFLLSKTLLDKFSDIYEYELNKLPYRLNLLDDLKTNENAHSKFLIRLLKYQPALINFLTFINCNNKHLFYFDVDVIIKPILTYEKMRIDGLIKENNKYAIIIENKIHNAGEQEHQIGRYIEKCRSIGFKIEQIFVLYLTKTKKDNHSQQTWGKYELEEFETRYSKLSYKSDILPWLESYLKVLSPKEELIKSAVVQYIDHLKHFFNKKEIYSNMNTELQKFLSTELDLSTEKVENIDVVKNKIYQVNELTEQLKELEKTSKSELFKEWKNNIDELPDFDETDKFIQQKASFTKTGVIINYKGNRFSVLIENNFNSTYFGFGRHHASDILDSGVNEFLKPLIEKEALNEALNEGDPMWYGWKYTTFNEGYNDFQNLLKLVLEKINSRN
jgi:hypothetical protein